MLARAAAKPLRAVSANFASTAAASQQDRSIAMMGDLSGVHAQAPSKRNEIEEFAKAATAGTNLLAADHSGKSQAYAHLMRLWSQRLPY
eukprot:2636325-Rhodomonas_salina.1